MANQAQSARDLAVARARIVLLRDLPLNTQALGGAASRGASSSSNNSRSNNSSNPHSSSRHHPPPLLRLARDNPGASRNELDSR